MPTDITSTLANATSAVTLQPGDYSISTNVAVNADLTMLSGAVISVPSGATLTLLRSLDAPLSQIFTGLGTVDLNSSRIPTAYPEWWGARADDGTFDNTPALTAAVVAHANVELLPHDYFIASTWKITTGHRTIRGGGSRWTPTTRGTRIVMKGGTADVMQVGYDNKPAGSFDDFLNAVWVSRLSLWRDAAPVRPPLGQDAGGPAGLRAQYLIHCRFDDVRTNEHSTGIYIGGCVATAFDDCGAFRSVPSTGSGANVFFGFYLNGNFEIGAAGGNASVYLTDCSAAIGGFPALTTSIGMALDGAFADTFVTRFETVTIAKGIVATGAAANGSAAVRKAGNLDLHIVAPVIDQCTDRGIEIGNLSAYAAVEIIDPYIAVAPGSLAAIQIYNGAGNVTLSGGQLIGFVDSDAAGNALGLLCQSQSGLRATGTKVIGFKRPVGLLNSTGFDLALDVSNPDQVASQAAIYLDGCDRGRITSTVRGQAGAFPQGIALVGSGNGHVMIDVTGVNPACVSGGTSNKLRIAGASVTSVGASGTNYVTGVTS